MRHKRLVLGIVGVACVIGGCAVLRIRRSADESERARRKALHCRHEQAFALGALIERIYQYDGLLIGSMEELKSAGFLSSDEPAGSACRIGTMSLRLRRAANEVEVQCALKLDGHRLDLGTSNVFDVLPPRPATLKTLQAIAGGMDSHNERMHNIARDIIALDPDLGVVRKPTHRPPDSVTGTDSIRAFARSHGLPDACDAWGTPLYMIVTQHGTLVGSAGPDRKRGTPDDIIVPCRRAETHADG